MLKKERHGGVSIQNVRKFMTVIKRREKIYRNKFSKPQRKALKLMEQLLLICLFGFTS
jgi:hypothetical protein